MILAHFTDVHLDHVDEPAATAGACIAEGLPEDAVILITGDIATAENFPKLLVEFAGGLQRRVYFLLGNHDAWLGSREGARRSARKLSLRCPKVTYLAEAGVVELSPRAALCGVDGWYDGRAGAGARGSTMELNDFRYVGELRGLHRGRRAEVLEDWAHRDARRAREVLASALDRYEHVFFGTHVPPFPEASLDPRGLPSGPHALPWFCNLTMGWMLAALAAEYTDHTITVFCGHTHGAVDLQVAPNLCVIVGGAVYGAPAIAGLHEVPE